MSKFKGDFVRAGQPIGIMGSTGHSTGKHLHYEVCKGGDCSYSYLYPYPKGQRQNPINYILKTPNENN